MSVCVFAFRLRHALTHPPECFPILYASLIEIVCLLLLFRFKTGFSQH